MGFWSLSNYDLFFIITDNIILKSRIEYYSLYLAPIFIFMYFSDNEDIKNILLFKIIYHIFILIEVIFLGFAIIGDVTNKITLPSLLGYNHTMLVIFIICIVALLLYEFKMKKLNNYSLLIGMGIFSVLIMSDIIRFNVLWSILTWSNPKKSGKATRLSKICDNGIFAIGSPFFGSSSKTG